MGILIFESVTKSHHNKNPPVNTEQCYISKNCLTSISKTFVLLNLSKNRIRRTLLEVDVPHRLCSNRSLKSFGPVQSGPRFSAVQSSLVPDFEPNRRSRGWGQTETGADQTDVFVVFTVICRRIWGLSYGLLSHLYLVAIFSFLLMKPYIFTFFFSLL